MGRLRNEAYAALDRAIAEDGEEDFLFKVCDLIATGEGLESVGRIIGIRPTVLKEWVKAQPKRIAEVMTAQECFANRLVYAGLQAARDATVEDVQVGKFQVDTYNKAAGKLSREEWGERVQMDVKTTHTVDIRALLDAREARLMGIADTAPARAPVHLPVVLSAVECEI